MIFSQMLDIIVLNDLASVRCARKFSFAPQGGIYPRKCPLLAKIVPLSLYLQNRASDFDDFCTDHSFYPPFFKGGGEQKSRILKRVGWPKAKKRGGG